MWLKYLVLTGARGFSGGANLLITLFVASNTSAEVMGELARMLNWTAFLAPYLTLGLVPYFTRELARRKSVDQSLIFNQALLHIVVILALAFLTFGLGASLQSGQIPLQISQFLKALAIAAVFAGSLIISGVMRGVGRPLLGDLPIYLLIPTIYATGIFIFSPSSSVQLFLLYSLAQLVAFGTLAFNLGHVSRWSAQRPKNMYFSVALIISTASTNLISAGQLALAGWIFESGQMANIHLGFIVTNSVNLAFSSVIAIHQRNISEAHNTGDRGILQNEIDSLNKHLFFIGLFLFAILILAIPILEHYLPDGYEQFSVIAYTFLVGQFFNFLGGASVMFYLTVGREKDLNYILIPIAVVGLIFALLASSISVIFFVSALALMTFSWNVVLVLVAFRKNGIKLDVISFLRK